MEFMHYSAPRHFALNVKNHLNKNFQNRWIGRGNNDPANWPSRSPNLITFYEELSKSWCTGQ